MLSAAVDAGKRLPGPRRSRHEVDWDHPPSDRGKKYLPGELPTFRIASRCDMFDLTVNFQVIVVS